MGARIEDMKMTADRVARFENTSREILDVLDKFKLTGVEQVGVLAFLMHHVEQKFGFKVAGVIGIKREDGQELFADDGSTN